MEFRDSDTVSSNPSSGLSVSPGEKMAREMDGNAEKDKLKVERRPIVKIWEPDRKKILHFAV